MNKIKFSSTGKRKGIVENILVTPGETIRNGQKLANVILSSGEKVTILSEEDGIVGEVGIVEDFIVKNGDLMFEIYSVNEVNKMLKKSKKMSRILMEGLENNGYLRPKNENTNNNLQRVDTTSGLSVEFNEHFKNKASAKQIIDEEFVANSFTEEAVSREKGSMTLFIDDIIANKTEIFGTPSRKENKSEEMKMVDFNSKKSDLTSQLNYTKTMDSIEDIDTTWSNLEINLENLSGDSEKFNQIKKFEDYSDIKTTGEEVTSDSISDSQDVINDFNTENLVKIEPETNRLDENVLSNKDEQALNLNKSDEPIVEEKNIVEEPTPIVEWEVETAVDTNEVENIKNQEDLKVENTTKLEIAQLLDRINDVEVQLNENKQNMLKADVELSKQVSDFDNKIIKFSDEQEILKVKINNIDSQSQEEIKSQIEQLEKKQQLVSKQLEEIKNLNISQLTDKISNLEEKRNQLEKIVEELKTNYELQPATQVESKIISNKTGNISFTIDVTALLNLYALMLDPYIERGINLELNSFYLKALKLSLKEFNNLSTLGKKISLLKVSPKKFISKEIDISDEELIQTIAKQVENTKNKTTINPIVLYDFGSYNITTANIGLSDKTKLALIIGDVHSKINNNNITSDYINVSVTFDQAVISIEQAIELTNKFNEILSNPGLLI